MDRMICTTSLAALLVAGCAEGVTADPYEFDSGIYELTTVGVGGDCVLEDAVSPGADYVGNLVRASLSVSDTAVTLTLCDDFFPVDCMAAPFLEPIHMIRDEDELYAQQPNWQVPNCTCFEDYLGSRDANGRVVEDGKAELAWTFAVPAAPQGCLCSTQACNGSLSQRLVHLGD